MAKHYTIPFFIPHEACPNRCVFCDQNKITGRFGAKPEELPEKITQYLSTMPKEGARVEVGFFGGSFTGLEESLQERFLDGLKPFLDAGRIHGIRLSTRPDYIDGAKLKFLKKKRVSCIELGVQSMSDKVLSASRRGHTSEDTRRSSLMIVENGFTLVHQIMLGLPLSSEEDEYFTARLAKELGAKEARIYPAIVIKNTELADMWEKGVYRPLAEEEAVRRSARLILFFEINDIKVIRCGLHPSEGLLKGEDFLAGPFHEAFRLKAESRIFSFLLGYIAEKFQAGIVNISFNPRDEAAFWGFERGNYPLIKRICVGNENFVKKDGLLPRGVLKITANNETLLLDRKKAAVLFSPEHNDQKFF